ncbi:hypothetical protein HMF8227_00168 [Saliniradius amylolyticus]|uniref:Saccharopine dehydrogenase NADP binding domain-containing protein n=1 Tax=Saliniradius amylolyticus TaxID=2183582 RepID=A0A2S2DZ70_9ALTE|nr:hypothetical protein [Saliniradius amylolyticus]AWL10676.1 hypothetical protein HMF8227_00168 [Saliniradius amylolyticus]
MTDIVLYGAASYEGKVYAQVLVAAGLKPLLADNVSSIHRQAKELLCPSQVIKLNGDWSSLLSDAKVLINLKAPYKKTQKKLLSACLKTQTHYLDFCDDIASLQRVYRFNNHAQDQGVMLMPGVGLTPTALVATMIKTLLNRPHQLVLFQGVEGKYTKAMKLSWLSKLPQLPQARRKGALTDADISLEPKFFELQGQRFEGIRDYWHGDLFTAGLDTGIANIDIYSTYPGWVTRLLRWRLRFLCPFLAFVNGLKSDKVLTDSQLKAGRTRIKAIASNGQDKRTLSLVGPHPVKWDALCLGVIVKEILNRHAPPGYQTPSVYGKALLDKAGSVTWLNH